MAHAISVHEVTSEFDYFTAVDDLAPDDNAGAGMIGLVEFNSSTLYRYATLDVNHLGRNLGDPEATRRAVEAFVRAFVRSMPTGKQNTFANRTLPDAVLLIARDSQPINLVGAFEEAIDERDSSGRIATSVTRLADYAQHLHTAFDETPLAGWTIGVDDRVAPLTAIGDRTTINALIDALGTLVTDRLTDQP